MPSVLSICEPFSKPELIPPQVSLGKEMSAIDWSGRLQGRCPVTLLAHSGNAGPYRMILTRQNYFGNQSLFPE